MTNSRHHSSGAAHTTHHPFTFLSQTDPPTAKHVHILEPRVSCISSMFFVIPASHCPLLLYMYPKGPKGHRVTKKQKVAGERVAREEKRPRTQTKMFSASSTAGRRDTENVIVANEHTNRGMVRELSRKTRRLQIMKHTMTRKTAGFSCFDLPHCVTMAMREPNCSSTVARGNNHETNSWCDTFSERHMEQRSRDNERKPSGFDDKGQASTSISRLQTFTDQTLQSET